MSCSLLSQRLRQVNVTVSILCTVLMPIVRYIKWTATLLVQIHSADGTWTVLQDLYTTKQSLSSHKLIVNLHVKKTFKYLLGQPSNKKFGPLRNHFLLLNSTSGENTSQNMTLPLWAPSLACSYKFAPCPFSPLLLMMFRWLPASAKLVPFSLRTFLKYGFLFGTWDGGKIPRQHCLFTCWFF